MSNFMFHSTSEKKSCFKVTNQMPQKIEISTSMRDKHVIIKHKYFSLNLPCPQASVARGMQSENRAKEIPMCDFIVNGWAMKVCVCLVSVKQPTTVHTNTVHKHAMFSCSVQIPVSASSGHYLTITRLG